MKKEKLALYHLNKRNLRINEVYSKYGDQIEQLIHSGHTANDIRAKYVLPSKFMNWYLEYTNLMYLAKHNAVCKLQKVARKNGKLSAHTLTGVHLKPLNESVVTWYVNSINSGKYITAVLNELREKFGYGRKKFNQLRRLYGDPIHNPNTGRLNPMYGKSPSAASGIGIKSHIYVNGAKYFCRSFLELKIFIYLMHQGISFEPSKHRIEYTHDGKFYTYCPDIVLMKSDTVIEIKPSQLMNTILNKEKFAAAIEYCVKNGLQFEVINESTYNLAYIDIDVIDAYINDGTIFISNGEYTRLVKNIKYKIR